MEVDELGKGTRVSREAEKSSREDESSPNGSRRGS